MLAPGGPWIITVPHTGIFRCLDPANFRLPFPFVYAAASRLTGGRDRALSYVGQKHGLVWHDHFAVEGLRRLLEPEFEVTPRALSGGACFHHRLAPVAVFPSPAIRIPFSRR